MKIKMLLLVVGLFSINLYSQEKTKQLPSVVIKDAQMKEFNTNELTKLNKPLIIDFWATWCKPCIKELIVLNDNYEQWQQETGVEIVIVSVDDSRSINRVVPFVKSYGWDFRILLDPNSDFKRALGVVDIPHTFILDTNGNILYEHTSFSEGDEQEYYKILKNLSIK